MAERETNDNDDARINKTALERVVAKVPGGSGPAPSRSADSCNCLLVYRSLSVSSKGAINAPHNNNILDGEKRWESGKWKGGKRKSGGRNVAGGREDIDRRRYRRSPIFQRPATYWRRHFDAVPPSVRLSIPRHTQKDNNAGLSVLLWLFISPPPVLTYLFPHISWFFPPFSVLFSIFCLEHSTVERVLRCFTINSLSYP